MSRAIFFGIILISSSVYLEATPPSELMKAESQCHAFIHKFDQKTTREVTRALYEQAFRLNFDAHYHDAQEASACAGWLDHGSKIWALEAKSLIN